MEFSNNDSSSSGRVGSSSDGGKDCESKEICEAQDEELSSSQVQRDSQLDVFYREWKREIGLSSRSYEVNSDQAGQDEENIEEKAKKLFTLGIQAERNRKLQDAISFYRRAIQLVPDIEFKMNESVNDNRDDSFVEDGDESAMEVESYFSEGTEIVNLEHKFLRLRAKSGFLKLCEPKVEQQMTHISDLPQEIFLCILKWVVSQDLDTYSLEQVAMVCRGFYLCARDSEIWRLICLRTFDVNIENANRYGSWRNMYIIRPHVSFNGVYISKTSYVRYGESSFQDTNYRPCFVIEYYRYIRFFPDGAVLMLTTPDDPHQSLHKLRHVKSKSQNVMHGHYKLVGNKVTMVVRKRRQDIELHTSNFYRYLQERPHNMSEVTDQTFHLEFEITNIKKKLNCKLCWQHYSIHTFYKKNVLPDFLIRDRTRPANESSTAFDLTPSKFPSLRFSRVKSYAAESESSLK